MNSRTQNYQFIYTTSKIEVIKTSPETASGVIATLKCNSGEIAEDAILEDTITGLKWEILHKPFCVLPPGAATGHKSTCPDTTSQDKTRREAEKQGIVQYFIRPLNHREKPKNGAILKLVYRFAAQGSN